MVTLSSVWKHALKDYEFIKLIGVGSYGEVVQAKQRSTGKVVAIKLIDNIFKSEYDSKKIVREVQIMRQLTQMEGNQFTTKLYDIITPKNLDNLTYIFIVMEYMQTDLKKIFQSMPSLEFTEAHMISLIYSMLCSLNFMHTANIIHRDIKPANLLVDSDCRVKICDFGLSRSQPVPEAPRGRLSRRDTAKILSSERELRLQKPRELSNHVVSRWYRPPEVILVEKHYGSAVDVWSTGCILSEMISCTDQYKANGVSPQERFLFTGTSCFPLSPCERMKATNSKKNIVSKNDQLKVILDILGDQNSEDTSFVSDQSAQDYIRTLKSNACKIQFKKEFPFTSPEILEILENMLEFNPHFRKNPAELLKNKIFDSIRKPEMEVAAPFQI